MKTINYTILILIFITSESVIAQSADLSLVKTANISRATVGQNVVYTLNANNAGPDANTQVNVVDFLPPEVSIVNMDPACAFDINSGMVNCVISLAANTSQALDIEVKVDTLPPAGPRVYLSGVIDATIGSGFFRYWLDSTQFDVLAALPGFLTNPRGIFWQADGSVFVADSGNLQVLGATPIIDGAIYYESSVQSLGLTIASGDLLVNPNDVIKAPNGLLYIADLNGVRLDGFGQPLADISGRIIEIDPTNATQRLVSEGGLLSAPTGLIWRNGQLIVIDKAGKLLSVDPTSGVQTLISQGGLFQSPEAVVYVASLYYVADSEAGVIKIDPLTGDQTSVTTTITNGGLVTNPIDIDAFNNTELYVLNGGVSSFVRIDLTTEQAIAVHDLSFNASQLNGFAVDSGESYLINNANIESLGATVDNNFENNSSTIATPVDTPQLPLQVLVQENITVSDLITLNPALQVLVQENITVADLIAINPALQVLVQENITVADLIALNPALQMLIQENITVSDTPNIVLVQPPRIVKVRPISGLCHNQIINDDVLPAALTELEISFSVAMVDPTGDTDAIDVSNPLNYRLVSTNNPNESLPSNCAAAIGPNSVDHNLSMRLYDANTKTAVLGSPMSVGLLASRYVLMACFDGLKAETGDLLDGNADGTAGDDYALRFSISATNLLKNPNFGNGVNDWTTAGNVNAVSNDADNALYAGSANIDLVASIAQCVELNGAKDMRFGASLQSDLASGNSTIMIEYYDAPQCTGVLTSRKQTQKAANNATWKNVAFDTSTPANSVSALVIVTGNTSQSPILMDRSYFVKTSNVIFKGNFETPSNTSNSCVQNNHGEG